MANNRRADDGRNPDTESAARKGRVVNLLWKTPKSAAETAKSHLEPLSPIKSHANPSLPVRRGLGGVDVARER